MATLYLDRKALEVARDGGRLILYPAGSSPSGIPLSGVSRVVIHGDVALSSGLLGTLAENGVGVLLLSVRHHHLPSGATPRRCYPAPGAVSVVF